MATPYDYELELLGEPWPEDRPKAPRKNRRAIEQKSTKCTGHESVDDDIDLCPLPQSGSSDAHAEQPPDGEVSDAQEPKLASQAVCCSGFAESPDNE